MRYFAVFSVLCLFVAGWLVVDTFDAWPGRTKNEKTVVAIDNSASAESFDRDAKQTESQPSRPITSTKRPPKNQDPRIRWALDEDDAANFADSPRGVLTRDPFAVGALEVAYADAKSDNDIRLIEEYGARLIRLRSNDVDLVIDCVAALTRANGLAAASRILAEARTRLPDNEALLRNFATLEQAQGRVTNAIEIWSEILATEPTDEQALAQRGLAYLQIMDWQAAREDLKKARKLDRDNIDVALDLAKAYEQLGEPSAAEVELRTIHKRYPKDVRVLNQLALLGWQQLLRGSPNATAQEITAWLDQSLAVAPGQSKVLALRTRVEQFRKSADQ